MVDSQSIEDKISEKKEKYEEKFEEGKEKFDSKKEERKEKYEDRKEKGKAIADNVITELYKTIDEIKDGVRNIQKNADQKYSEYKKSTTQNIDIEFVETKDTYYIKAAVPGIAKDDILVEAGDNDIHIEATFSRYIDEFEENETATEISSTMKTGKCAKTVRFENSIDIENISAKYENGLVILTIPKLIIPKHKINVE